MLRENIEIMKKNFESRNIDFKYFYSREELLSEIEKSVENTNTVGIGNSVTLKELGISKLVYKTNNTVYDKTLADTKEEITKLKKLALTSDLYISSSNAISLDGKIINIDHSGNRVAALTYGPDRVIIVIGKNKVEKTEKEALRRALTVATPLNAKRADIKSPCSLGNDCSSCTPDVRVCNYVSVIRGQHYKGRMAVYMIDEHIGY